MDIKILGAGCHDCLRLELLVGRVLAALSIEASVQRIEDARQIDRYALAGPPGLIINGQLVAERRLPSKEELRRWIMDALSRERRAWTT
ncbi:MAG: thioredoxin family protein [Anaerolineae bacterium]